MRPSNPVIRRLVRAVSAVFAFAAPPVPAAHDISWMYDADVPVQNQSQQARLEAAEAGFRQVLGRLTGMGENGLDVQVSGASADPLMTRFSYHSVVADGRRQPRVKLAFDPGQTLATVRNAGLPVWGATRPEVKLYLLSQEADGSRIPLDETHPVRQAMVQQAWVRGLVLTFPAFNDTEVPVDAMLDAVNPNRVVDPATATAEAGPAVETGEAALADATQVSMQDSIRGTNQDTTQDSAEDAIDEAVAPGEAGAAAPCAPATPVLAAVEPPPEPFLPGSIPRENELVLVGEFRTLPPVSGGVTPDQPSEPRPGPAFRWALGADRGVIDLPVGDAVAQGRQVVDRIADVMGRRFAVLWANPRAQTLQIAAVTRIPAYAELMRYLGQQEIFARVDLLEAGPLYFVFSVVTPADVVELQRVFQVDDRLRPEQRAVAAAEATEITVPAGVADPSCKPPGTYAEAVPAAPGIAAEAAEGGRLDTGLPVFVWQN